MKEKIMLRSRAKKLKPSLRIGKSGLTDGVAKEIVLLLKNKKLVKIKLLASSVEGNDKKSFAEKIASKTQSELVESVGNVVVLHRK